MTGERSRDYGRRELPPCPDIFHPDDLDAYLNYISDYSAKMVEGKSVTTSQIRNIFSRMKKLEALAKKDPDSDSCIADVKRLRVQFAYNSGRNYKNAIYRAFMNDLDELAQKIKTNRDVLRFYEFVEAIVAYMKYHGGEKA
ncbi:MAG TPA: type III-A CRISPR-associated protein Csm2 [Firmicutes bacterium]|nr:type III-A CRISPR-associated protein Csm2 [Bacillota bacterium]